MFRRLVSLSASAALAAGLLLGLQAPAQAHERHGHHGHGHAEHGHGGHGHGGHGHHGHGQHGTLYEQGVNDDPYTYEDTDCGFTIRTEGQVYNPYKIYRAPGSTEAFLLHSWTRWRETLTNPATGKRMYVSGRSYFREIKATHLEGDIYEFIAVESGDLLTIRDSRGRVVLADRGTVVTRTVQDTLGDGVPGSEQLSYEVLKERGHIQSYDEDFDFCAIASRLIG